LLNADQDFGHHRFSSQILAAESLPGSTDLAAVGSGSRFWELAGTISEKA
jgi:hypothetical protein